MKSYFRMGFCVCLSILAAQPLLVAAQARIARSGVPIPLASDLTMTVVRGTNDVFKNVDVEGPGLVLELQIEPAATTKYGFIVLRPFKDPEKSTVVLVIDGIRFAPKAIADTGGRLQQAIVTRVSDLLPTPKDGLGLTMRGVEGGKRQSVHLLFDIPVDALEKPMKLLVDMGLDGEPTPLEIEIMK